MYRIIHEVLSKVTRIYYYNGEKCRLIIIENTYSELTTGEI